MTEGEVVGKDLLGGALAFGTEPELSALGPGALGAVDGSGEGDVVDGVILLAGVAEVHGRDDGGWRRVRW